AAILEILRPAAIVVDKTVPGPLHDRVRDFNANLKEPRIFINNVLQGRAEAAVHTGARFAMNSVFGVAGLFDIATREGLQQESGDFGQTLLVWGVPAGPYVVRPWMGPATLRDAAGSVVDMFADPIGFATGSRVWLSVGQGGLDAVEKLGQLKQAEDASIDFYSFVRSAYYQTRRAELRQAIGQENVVDSPALLDDPAEPAACQEEEEISARPYPPRINVRGVLRCKTRELLLARPHPDRQPALPAFGGVPHHEGRQPEQDVARAQHERERQRHRGIDA